MTTMVERVAKAIMPEAFIFGEEARAKQPIAFERARAAIEAMRDPTEAMIDAGADGSGEGSTRVALGAWADMIEEALKDEK